MSRSPWICEVCQAIVRLPSQRVEKRIEYRQASDYSRRHVVTVGRLCSGCADAEVEALRPSTFSAQAHLFNRGGERL